MTSASETVLKLEKIAEWADEFLKESIPQGTWSFDQLETWAAAGEEVTAARGMHPDGWTAEAEPAASLKGASAIGVQADPGWTAEAEGEEAERRAAAAATALAAAAAAEATHNLRASKGKGGLAQYRIPPPAGRADPKKEVSITEEQRQHSISLEGYLYATIDFTSPQAQPPWTTEPDARYTYQTKTDISVIRAKNLPSGWEVAPATETVIREVIKPYSWGTHLLVTEGCKAYWTAAGNNPGCLEALWDYEKLPGRTLLSWQTGDEHC
ncbi:hypothetical protein AK812_SmicGene28824 [Symbiodinium microadriaticum]|uniref:Uncharacterized protein n=1 Tax=Symbiodinium microadriaticum TaxID=2951 RepID=A0A1Q9D3B7_SYMMI|nr:hypothetical protein AK812_SmicGene28824 [Symbiodinium microadriaticum]